MEGCLNSARPSGREPWRSQSQGPALGRTEIVWEMLAGMRTVDAACGIQAVGGVHVHITASFRFSGRVLCITETALVQGVLRQNKINLTLNDF